MMSHPLYLLIIEEKTVPPQFASTPLAMALQHLIFKTKKGATQCRTLREIGAGGRIRTPGPIDYKSIALPTVLHQRIAL